MSEIVEILKTIVSDAHAGRAAALCAIVRTQGSAPQSAGAVMLVREDMSTVGTIGGGCVEAEVRTQAFQLLSRRKSGVLDFLLDHDYGWDDGLICGGRMFVGVMPVTRADAAPFQAALNAARLRKPGSFFLRVEENERPAVYRVNVEVPPTLVIAGAGHVGRAVARLAVTLDFRVVVIDDRADMASRARFDAPTELVVGDIASELMRFNVDEGTYIVIVTRGHQHDHKALDAVIRRPARYVGLIGSRRKARMILADLERAGATPAQIARVRTPIGLSIGAVTVEEIAVSIAAELIQERRKDANSVVEGPMDVTQCAGANSL